MDQQISVLKQQYLQLLDPSLLSFPPTHILQSPAFQSALYTSLFTQTALEPAPPQPPKRYTARVLKKLIALLSETIPTASGYEEEQEIDERLLSLYTQLISSVAPPPMEKENVTYTLPPSPFSGRPIGQPITLLESRAVISGSGTTGLRTWEAALALAEYLICSHLGRFYNIPGVQGEMLVQEAGSVLELGAGTGFVGIVAARLGAGRVVLTDGDESVCEGLKDTVERNGVTHVAEVKRLMWGEREGREGEGFDLVVGADVTYDSSAIPYLVAELVTQFDRNPHVKVIISATIRNEDTFSSFRNFCARNSLLICEKTWTPPTPPIFYYPTNTPIQVIRITRESIE